VPSEIKSYHDLVAWQKAITLANMIYACTADFPSREMYGLSSQLRRAVVSIASNIAEGSVRGSNEFIHFINIARGSLAEVQTQLLIAKNQHFLDENTYQTTLPATDELSRILMGLLKSLKATKH
jgi:four helix bundle protein